MKGRVIVSLRTGVLDVEGKAIGKAIESLGLGPIGDVRVGRVFEVDLGDVPREDAEVRLKAMAQRLLANPVMETWRVELLDPSHGAR